MNSRQSLGKKSKETKTRLVTKVCFKTIKNSARNYEKLYWRVQDLKSKVLKNLEIDLFINYFDKSKHYGVNPVLIFKNYTQNQTKTRKIRTCLINKRQQQQNCIIRKQCVSYNRIKIEFEKYRTIFSNISKVKFKYYSIPQFSKARDGYNKFN